MSNLFSSYIENRKNTMKTQNLSENFLQNFIDLSDSEKYLVIKKIIDEQPTPYDDLNERILNLFKQNISQPFFTDNNLLEIKMDSILNKISNNIIILLHNWSYEKFRLHEIFNHSLPKSIRFIIWYLYLSNANHHQKFLNDLTNHPQSILTPMDNEIQDNCNDLIKKLSFISDMNNSKEILYTMKTILSYYRSLFINKHDLIDAEYYYVIPIILSYSTFHSETEEFNEKSLSILIEMYRTFLEKLPLILRNTYLNNSIENLEPWFHKIEYYLKNIDQIFYNHIQTILHSAYTHTSANNDSHILVLLRKCCYTWFKYMFVGCFTTDSLLFVWDQYLITSDIDNFHDEILPIIATAIIIILKDLLIKCKKASEIEEILQYKTNTILTYQLQSIINQFFLPDFKIRIMKSDIVSNNSHTKIHQQMNNKSKQELNIKVNPLHDLLHTIVQTCNRVMHGQGNNNTILNKQTKNDIYIHKFDLKMAERDTIGKILSIEERNALSYEQKKIYNQQKFQAVNKRIQTRYIFEHKILLDKN